MRYRKTKINGKTFNVHRRLMEIHLGRTLTRDEVVHHINGDRLDNRIENLEVMTHKQHAVHHKQKHPVTKSCTVCNREYEPHPTKRARSKSCSRECAKVLMRDAVMRREAAKRLRRSLPPMLAAHVIGHVASVL